MWPTNQPHHPNHVGCRLKPVLSACLGRQSKGPGMTAGAGLTEGSYAAFNSAIPAITLSSVSGYSLIRTPQAL